MNLILKVELIRLDNLKMENICKNISYFRKKILFFFRKKHEKII
jgi:hypothetical protein